LEEVVVEEPEAAPEEPDEAGAFGSRNPSGKFGIRVSPSKPFLSRYLERLAWPAMYSFPFAESAKGVLASLLA
jgi:hypothetical protein